MALVNQEPCEILEWDTAFFGFPIARVREDVLTQERIQQIDIWCRRTGVSCLYFLSCVDDANTIMLAEDNDFRLADIRMTFECKAPGAVQSTSSQPNGDVLVRDARPEDVAMLQDIARKTYYGTRFYFDVNFPRHLCESLYETWIKLSCEGYADAVLVAELGALPVGYISCHLEEEPCIGRIGLVGVASQARGRGIGQTLVFGALDWFWARGVQEVLVVTQGRNRAAQRLYQRCGFLTKAVQLWYHRWYTHSESTGE
jgi:dTDP-4-amino-4,6-dideoxy-D-galactose acyltransferase